VTSGARSFAAALLTGWLAAGLCLSAQQTSGIPPESAGSDSSTALPSPAPPDPIIPATVVVPLNEDRMFLVMPDYATVQDSSRRVAPMTSSEKWNLAWKETIDPFNIATAAMTAASSQRDNQTPKYGEGWASYGKRFGAAIADFGTQNFFSAGVFANLLHQDPRYFRKGPTARILPRIWYSATRVLICRDDSGRPVLNTANLFGLSLGIAASNIYYPSASRTGTVMAGRVETSLFGGVMGNLMSEFWPDVQRKFFQKKPKR
jgi:hypothetical protein